MGSALEPILHSPRLPEYFRQIECYLREESEQRQRFYDVATEDKKQEFINGQVITHGPATSRDLHAVKDIAQMLDTFVGLNRLGVVHSHKSMCRFPRNDYEPDVVFFGKGKAADFTAKTMLFPPPDLVVEVLSDSTAKNDRGVKFEDYEQHVPEYWIVDADEETVEQYVKRAEGYHLKVKAASGELVSEAMPGFSIPVKAVFDEAENLRALELLLKQS